MRHIPARYKNTPAAQTLEEAQAQFIKASEELLAVNRVVRVEGNVYDQELERKADSLKVAEEQLAAAEAEFDRAIGESVPVPLTKKVVAKLQLSFPLDQQAKAKQLLEMECVELPLVENNTPAGLERIRLAVLKVAAGDLDQLGKQIDSAKNDWRDVINQAEYPEASSLGLVGYSKLDTQTREDIERRDREQYEEWLVEGESANPLRRLWHKIMGTAN